MKKPDVRVWRNEQAAAANGLPTDSEKGLENMSDELTESEAMSEDDEPEQYLTVAMVESAREELFGMFERLEAFNRMHPNLVRLPYKEGRPLSLVLTKLEECDMWLYKMVEAMKESEDYEQ